MVRLVCGVVDKVDAVGEVGDGPRTRRIEVDASGCFSVDLPVSLKVSFSVSPPSRLIPVERSILRPWW